VPEAHSPGWQPEFEHAHRKTKARIPVSGTIEKNDSSYFQENGTVKNTVQHVETVALAFFVLHG
jgi:hypothetical protein